MPAAWGEPTIFSSFEEAHMKHMPAALFDREIADLVPVRQQEAEAGHVFDLPPVLHGATIACYFAFLGIMATAFGGRDMVIPFAIFFFFVAMGFAVPAMWAHIAPPKGRVPDWADFRYHGIECATGHLRAVAAIAQVMVLPVLILLWAVIIATIVASI
jgi:hypothetical protein